MPRSAKVALQSEKTSLLSGWIRRPTGSYSNLGIRFFNAAGEKVGDNQCNNSGSSNRDKWRYFNLRFAKSRKYRSRRNQISENAVSMQVYIQNGHPDVEIGVYGLHLGILDEEETQ